MQHLAVAETMAAAGKTFAFALLLEMAVFGLVGCHAGFPNAHEAQALGLAAGSGGDCAACLAGDASFCRLISGIFTRSQLPPGYNLIAQIPRGACNVNITEMKHSRNYLSLRHTGGGGSILNGNWARDWSGDYPAAGTIFTYHRHDPRGGPKAGESISAPGPTTAPVDLLLVVPHQNPNPGIQYQYHIPITPKVALAGAPVFANLPSGPKKHPTEFENTNRVLQVAPNHARSNHASPLEGQVGNFNPQRGRKLRPPPRVNLVDHPLPFQPSNLIYQNSATNPPISGHRFVWRVSEVTPCSKSCGGGERRTIMSCVKEANSGPILPQHSASLQHPSEVNEGATCDPSAPPVETVGRCNIKPCPAEWVAGEWSPCSVSCGEGGIQTRDVWCQQEISPTLRMRVAEGACLTSPSTLPRTRQCPIPPVPCHRRRWITSEWEDCSVTCGEGVRRRKVKCTFPGEELNDVDYGSESSEDETEGIDDECPPEERPPEEESCDMGSCSKDTWFFSEWSEKCSSDCGSGLRTRQIHCSGAGANEIPGSGSCDPSSKPQETMPCTSSCPDGVSSSWFAGPWSKCAAKIECVQDYQGQQAAATQTRDVLCVSVSEGKFVVVEERNCSGNLKPITSRACEQNDPKETAQQEDDYDNLDLWNAKADNKTLPNCNPEWYMTDWSQCSASCGTGHQTREVKCLDRNQQPALGCSPQQRPAIKQECNTKPCNHGSSHPHHHHHSHHQRHHQKHSGTSCKDELRNCQLVVQARLCHYNYYRNACCFSCGNKS